MNKLIAQTGDTIIEVLIAIAIISLVLASAFAITSRDLQDIHQAQEHTSGLKFAENQLEQLRSMATSNFSDPANPGPSYTIFSDPNAFCINTSGTVQNSTTSPILSINPTNFPVLNSSSDNLSIYSQPPSGCTFINGVNYQVAIVRLDTASSPSHIFTVHVRWDSIHGIGHDEVVLSYGLDQ